jgi:hypothetical protein
MQNNVSQHRIRMMIKYPLVQHGLSLIRSISNQRTSSCINVARRPHLLMTSLPLRLVLIRSSTRYPAPFPVVRYISGPIFLPLLLVLVLLLLLIAALVAIFYNFMTTGTHRDARYPHRIHRLLQSHTNMPSSSIITLALRAAQFTLASITLGLSAYGML